MVWAMTDGTPSPRRRLAAALGALALLAVPAVAIAATGGSDAKPAPAPHSAPALETVQNSTPRDDRDHDCPFKHGGRGGSGGSGSSESAPDAGAAPSPPV